MDQLGLKRYCCRRMVMTHVDLVEKLLKYVDTFPGRHCHVRAAAATRAGRGVEVTRGPVADYCQVHPRWTQREEEPAAPTMIEAPTFGYIKDVLDWSHGVTVCGFSQESSWRGAESISAGGLSSGGSWFHTHWRLDETRRYSAAVDWTAVKKDCSSIILPLLDLARSQTRHSTSPDLGYDARAGYPNKDRRQVEVGK